ncbi:MAG: hypothetical protein H0V61_06150 [Chitinophagales bacterium]|nr:hypothetical protein [Chitinophagales bacterium]
MKLLLIILWNICFFISLTNAQMKSGLLDGKKYSVEMYVGKEKDTHEQLSFSNGIMDFLQSTKYGFVPDEYKFKQKNDSTYTFLTISRSKKNGVMTWEGKIVNDDIEGTCIWTRLVENPVNYTFKGKMIEE